MDTRLVEHRLHIIEEGAHSSSGNAMFALANAWAQHGHGLLLPPTCREKAQPASSSSRALGPPYHLSKAYEGLALSV